MPDPFDHAEVRGACKGGESISGLKADKMRHNLQGGCTTSPAGQASHGDTKTRRKVLGRTADVLIAMTLRQLRQTQCFKMGCEFLRLMDSNA